MLLDRHGFKNIADFKLNSLDFTTLKERIRADGGKQTKGYVFNDRNIPAKTGDRKFQTRCAGFFLYKTVSCKALFLTGLSF